ncbi:MAG: hypothetical protein LBK96_03955 [Prevotellaceae bacterium]|jgi:hypothetical protein|nr:hypothetical protein [Prevotellaceae bacterium]
MSTGHRYIQYLHEPQASHKLKDKPVFKISPLLQERMVYLGQLTNYEEGVSVLREFYGIEISKTQHFRVTNYYGEQIAPIIEKAQESALPEKLPDNAIVYAECDGSMILTREKEEDQNSNSWEEVKVLRKYTSYDTLSSGTRNLIENSEYAAHLGGHSDFEAKAERLLDNCEHLGKNLVFISDGASWIHRWQSDIYPHATQILDYYHVCEHMAAFAQVAIPDEKRRKDWLTERKSELLDSQPEKVIKQIQQISKTNKSAEKEAQKLINYYTVNKDRMNYKNYSERGLRIGSGAIEAAHRNVVQKRMKQSGQRWSREHAQYVLNLRTCFMSGKWNEVIEMIRKYAA